MERIEVDIDAARNVVRQAEMLESRLEHLLITWKETARRMSPTQAQDLIEGLRNAALEHRLALQEIARRYRTGKD